MLCTDFEWEFAEPMKNPPPYAPASKLSNTHGKQVARHRLFPNLVGSITKTSLPKIKFVSTVFCSSFNEG